MIFGISDGIIVGIVRLVMNVVEVLMIVVFVTFIFVLSFVVVGNIILNGCITLNTYLHSVVDGIDVVGIVGGIDGIDVVAGVMISGVVLLDISVSSVECSDDLSDDVVIKCVVVSVERVVVLVLFTFLMILPLV